MSSKKRLFDHCPMCGDGLELPATRVYSDEFDILCCLTCGVLVSGCDVLSYQDSLIRWSETSSFTIFETDFRRLKRRRAKDVLIAKGYLGSDGEYRWLDVGCGCGFTLAALSQLGIDSFGVEPSVLAVQAGLARGFDIKEGTLAECSLASSSVDVVSFYEVVEHLTNPLEVLAEATRVLRANGVLILGTGNSRSLSAKIRGGHWRFWSLKKNGGHIVFFNDKTLVRVVEQLGFEHLKTVTYGVTLVEKGEVPRFLYRLIKMVSEVLNACARVTGRGEQMECFFRKK